MRPQYPKKDTNPLQRSLVFPALPSQAADRCKDITVVCIAIVVRFYWFFVYFFVLFCFLTHIIVIIQNIQTRDAKQVVGHHAPGQGVTPCDLQREGRGGMCSTWQGTVGTPESLGGGRTGPKRWRGKALSPLGECKWELSPTANPGTDL